MISIPMLAALALAADDEATRGPPDLAQEWNDHCGEDGEWDRATYRICVDAMDGPRVAHLPTKPWSNPLPHQTLVVLVHHKRQDVVTVTANGTTGVYTPGTDGAAPEGEETPMVARVTTSDASGGTERFTRYVLPRYLPGNVTLTVAVVPTPLRVVEWSASFRGLDDARATLATAELRALRNKAAVVDVGPFSEAVDAAKDAIDAAVAGSRAFAPSTEQGEDWVGARITDTSTLTTKIAKVATTLNDTFKAPAADPVTDAAKAAMTATFADATEDLRNATRAATALAETLGGHATTAPLTQTLVVEPTYTGSLRLGAAIPFGGAADGNYRVGMPPDAADTTQLVVLDDGSSPVDLELVLGYTQYFHRRPRSAVRPRVGAFAALGLVDLQQTEVSVLESVYAGAEFGWSNLSIGAALAVRNVTRLGNGLEVGSPVTSADADITVDRPSIGFALVIFPTPDIWKADFSKKKGTSTTTAGSSDDATPGVSQ